MVAFRVDANEYVGLGHLMRCIALADAMCEQGVEVVFFTVELSCYEVLLTKNYSCILLEGRFDDLNCEINQLIGYMVQMHFKAIVIDSYYVNQDYFDDLSQVVKTIYIDDDNKPLSVDCVINYSGFNNLSTYTDWKAYKIIGSEYALLRKEFWNIKKRKVNCTVKNCVVLSGGSDPYSFIIGLCERIVNDKRLDIVYKVILGRYYDNMEKLRELTHNCHNILLLDFNPNIIGVYNECDVAISASGTALYELGALGVPIIAYSYSDNQVENIEGFIREGLVDYAGDLRKNNMECIERCCALLDKVCNDYEYRRKQANLLQKRIAGDGAIKVAKILANSFERGC